MTGNRNQITAAVLSAALISLAASLASCASWHATLTDAQQPGTPPAAASPAAPAPAASWPQGLPQDRPQPWETSPRGAGAFDSQTELLPGAERFLEAGDVTDLGEASRLESGEPGAGAVAWAMYRLELSGQQPGAIALDVNLPARADGSTSSYFVGLSDYSGLRWEWHGPYDDNHIRLARAGSPGPDVMAATSYLSEAGSSFVTIVAFDGSRADVLALEVEPLSITDSTAPPVPAGLSLSPVAGGLSLQWNSVIAEDLAGYRVYCSNSSFDSPGVPGVRSASYLEGSTRMMLKDLQGQHFVRISSIDHNGNESALSAEQSASPLAGNLPQISLELDQPSVLRGETVSLSVTADSSLLLDYDLDGDGSFEISGSTETSQVIDTSATGIIRPLVRASSEDGEFQAYGGVSLIVAGNSRPVASAQASPASGNAPLEVSFSALDSTDFDGAIVGGGWDFDGDGVYDAFDTESTDELEAMHSYETPGLFNAKLRVIDDQGSFDVDTVSILVEGPGVNLPPVAQVICDVPVVLLGQLLDSVPPTFDASASYDPEGSELEYSFDPEGDGFFTAYSPVPTLEGSFPSPGNFLVAAKVRDSAGLEALAYCLLKVRRFAPEVPVSGHQLANKTSLTALQAGLSSLVGIAYNNASTDDLLFIRSTDMLATDWLPPLTVDSLGGEWMSLAQEASQFNLAYYRDGDLFFKASQNDGASFNITGTPDNTGDDAGNFCSCALIVGRPAIAYHNATSGALYFVRAANSSGSGAWDSPVLVDDTGNTGQYPSLITAVGSPMIAYYRADNGNLLAVRAANSTGSSWNSPVIADNSADDVGRFASLTSVAVPTIAYFNATQNRIQYIKAEDSQGSSWGSPQVVVNTAANSLQQVRVNGYPTIFFNEGANSTRFVRSVDFEANAWGAAVSIEGSGAGSLLACSVSDFDQLPMLSYYDGVGLELHFARPRID